MTYHPVTLDGKDPAAAMRAILQALDSFPEVKVVITQPNADAGGRIIMELAGEYALKHPERVLLATTLGPLKYLSAMQHCGAVIGNSSSGIVEAPALRKATVNIGERQTGRLKASSIIDCSEECADIVAALREATSVSFQAQLPSVESLYGWGSASREIKQCIKTFDLAGILIKRFHDVDLPPGSSCISE
jgi:UDP-hydrolysing UDP-N-acetyl-D-glucosamine 2-epimerase